ncbi:MAG: D-alanyl-D-alanine carboxypeptidase/D-alanyl-D-alanine-endopeptidase [Nitriliruptoraceae bacterium]
MLALLVAASLALAACVPGGPPSEGAARGPEAVVAEDDRPQVDRDAKPPERDAADDAPPASREPGADEPGDARGADGPGADRAGSPSDQGQATDERLAAAAPPAPRPPGPPPASRARIEAEAASLLAGLLERRDGEQVSVLVVDEYGREVAAHDPDVPVLPASTLKIVTAAAALITFGPDARFTTRIETTAPIDGDGVVRGDLVLVGTGDPVLATPEYGRWIYPARPRTPFEDLATQLAAAGITEVTGDVVGVVERFDGPLTASGWPDRYFNDFDARFADGLAVDAGVRTIVTYPEVEDEDAGEDGEETSAAPSDQDAEDSGDEGDAEDEGDGGQEGDGEPTGPPTVRIEHTRSPAEHAVDELIRLLGEHDIEVTGEGRVGAPAAASVGRVATVTSPPLEEILRFAVQRSDNQITDAVFRAVGRQRTGVGSFASGERALKQVLERLGIATEGAVFADGSGLSRDDRATVRLLVELDRAMHTSRHAPTWTSLMAVMGESGTLASRLDNTVADGWFLGKTGTLRDVAALTGAVVGDDGRRYHLAVIANADGQARWLSRTFVDEVIVLLSADVRGCDVLTGTGEEGALGRPPVAVRC